MDFMSVFPHISRGSENIWVIVNRLTKSNYFFPIKICFSLDRLAHIYVRDIIRLHGVPVFNILNQGLTFTFRFWRSFQEELGTQINFITLILPKNNFYLKQTIYVLENIPQVCVLDFRGQWEKYLCLVELVYNNSYHFSIVMTPFEALYGMHYLSPIGQFETSQIN